MSSEAMFEIFVTIFGLILKASWLMLPAYMANPTAVVFGGGTPIDLGKNWKDGRRIFGDGKTFRGLIGGTICGVITGLIQMQVTPLHNLGTFTYISIFTLSFGALLGDMTKAFLKEGLGMNAAQNFPLLTSLILWQAPGY